MEFNIKLCRTSIHAGLYYALFETTFHKVQSAPQNLVDYYRDLWVNYQFFIKKELSAIFVCSEPLLRLHYENEVVKIFIFTQIGGEVREIVCHYEFLEVKSYWHGFIDAMRVAMDAIGSDYKSIEILAMNEIKEGVYDEFRQK